MAPVKALATARALKVSGPHLDGQLVISHDLLVRAAAWPAAGSAAQAVIRIPAGLVRIARRGVGRAGDLAGEDFRVELHQCRGRPGTAGSDGNGIGNPKLHSSCWRPLVGQEPSPR